MTNKTLIKTIGNYNIYTFENPFNKEIKNIVIENSKTGSCNYPIIYSNGKIGFDFTPIQKVRTFFNYKNLLKHKLI